VTHTARLKNYTSLIKLIHVYIILNNEKSEVITAVIMNI